MPFCGPNWKTFACGRLPRTPGLLLARRTHLFLLPPSAARDAYIGSALKIRRFPLGEKMTASIKPAGGTIRKRANLCYGREIAPSKCCG